MQTIRYCKAYTPTPPEVKARDILVRVSWPGEGVPQKEYHAESKRDAELFVESWRACVASHGMIVEYEGLQGESGKSALERILG